MRLKSLMVVLGLAVFAAGCSQQGYGPKQTVGGLGGAALGGLLGAQFGGGTGQLATTAAGALLGGIVGSEIGRSLDDNDRRQAETAAFRAHRAPVGETVSWSNPQSGNYGTVTPVREGTSSSGRYCREYQQTVTVGGRTQDAYGVACRQPDGSWEILQ